MWGFNYKLLTTHFREGVQLIDSLTQVKIGGHLAVPGLDAAVMAIKKENLLQKTEEVWYKQTNKYMLVVGTYCESDISTGVGFN